MADSGDNRPVEREKAGSDRRGAVESELRFHLDMTAAELERAGLSPAAARAEASRRFGSKERYARSCRAIESRRGRARRRGGTMSDFQQDLGYALRTLRRSPWFTVIAMATLALSIGANTAAFTVVNAVVLRPLPYGRADEIVSLWMERGHGSETEGFSFPDYLDLRDRSEALEDIGFWVHWGYDVDVDGRPQNVPSVRVSANMFDILGVEPALGRIFLPDEALGGAESVVLVSHRQWQSRYGGDPDLLGRTLLLDDEPYRVIGIMPEGFRFPYEGDFGLGFWTPMVFEPDQESRSSRWLNAVGRLAPAATVEQARREISTISSRLAEAYPTSNAGWTARLVRTHDAVVGENARRALWVLYGVVGFVLLIACANLANLLLIRVESRQREMAVRFALGAGRVRIFRQLLTESGMLALTGGVAGLLLARWGLDTIIAMIPADVPRLDEISIDGAVLLFTLTVSLATGLIFGLLPARSASHTDLHETLKVAGGRVAGAGRQRFRSLLVVAEIATALVLAIFAGLLMRSFAELMGEDLGFDPSAVLTFEVAPDGEAFERLAFYEELLARLDALPDVVAAGANSAPPLSGVEWATPFRVVGAPEPNPGEEPTAQFNYATPGYFRTLGIPVRRGRPFTAADRASRPPVAVVNETLAQRHWPYGNAVGEQIRLSGRGDESPPIEIVGVVADVRKLGIDRPPTPEIFLPVGQQPGYFLNYVVRTRDEPLALADAARAIVWEIRDDVAVENVTTLELAIDGQVAQPRFNMLLLGGFAALALLLATLGIYGVVSYAVTERTNEIGVRMALGAGSDDVFRLMVGHGVALTSIGLGLGMAAAFASTRLLGALLYEVEATDPLVWACVAVLLATFSIFASWVPARRATRVDPIVALRAE